MNKSTRTIRGKRQSLSDFVSRLGAKWQQTTTPTHPAISSKQESLEDILGQLIAIPTVTGNYEANHEVLNYIEQYLVRYGMHIRRHEWNGVESLVATTHPTKTPTVFLTAHVDVVAAPQELFELKSKGDKYYGRGVLDMKGALAAYLGVVQHLENHLQEYDFGIMVTTDEEIGGFDGASKLADEGYLAKVMVLPDGGLNNWDMEHFAKGMWWITLEAAGKVAHGSRPWEGSNPIDALITALREVQALFADQGPDTSTISLSVFHSGQTINQIPAAASASIDIRLANLEDQARIYNEVTKIADRYQLKLTTEVESDPMVNDPENEYLKIYKACTEKVIGHPINWVVSNAGNDGRFFAKRGVQCAIAYPLGGGHHGAEEWVSKDSLAHMQQLFLNYIEKVAHTR